VATTDHPNIKTQATDSKRNILSGILFGLGFAAFIDETVFHQLLHWHHFYDKSTTNIGLVSDGLFHAFSWFATIGASFLFSDLRRRNALDIKKWVAGLLLGAGGFQFYDGTIQHKIMKIHQIRYNVDVFPYDLIWNLLAAGMILAGAFILYRIQRETASRGGSA
jgi:uncharacterized membrane protein